MPAHNVAAERFARQRRAGKLFGIVSQASHRSPLSRFIRIGTALFASGAGVLLLAGCDRRDKARIAAVAAAAAQAAPTADAMARVMDLRTVTRLIPKRPTHIAVDRLGNLYWTQETASAQDVMFVAGQDDAPRSTSLTSAAILTAMGPIPAPPPRAAAAAARANASAADPAMIPEVGAGVSSGVGPGVGLLGGDPSGAGVAAAGTGNIQSLVADQDGGILFYFNGGVGWASRSCLGRFDPRSEEIRILAGPRQLSRISNMGASIDLARGTLMAPLRTASGEPPRVWLWLRHSDAWVLIRFNPRQAAAIESGSFDFDRPYTRIHGDGAPESLTGEGIELAAGLGAEILLSDSASAELWALDETGTATKLASLVGLPRALSEPFVSEQPGEFSAANPGAMAESSKELVYLFAGQGERALGKMSTDSANAVDPRAAPSAAVENAILPMRYPGLLALAGGRMVPVVSRPDIRLRQDFVLDSLQLRDFVPDPVAGGWVAFDAPTGEIMRVQLRGKE